VAGYARLHPAYLAWLSRTLAFVDWCKAASEGTTNRVRLKEQRFLGTGIPLPPLSEQRRIVARIEALAARIAEAKRLREEAEAEVDALVKSEMRKAFNGDGATPVVMLDSVCAAVIDNLHSNPVYADEGVPCVRSPDVGWGRLNLKGTLKTSEEEYVRRTVRGEPRPDDIVFVREGGGTGKAALVELGHRFSLGQRVMMLRPDTSAVLPRFFLYQLLSPTVYEEQVLPLITGSASPHLNISALRAFRFVLPPLGEQRRIVDHLDQLRATADSLGDLQRETAAELDALLPAILAEAFAGQL
jgi:type I restriction enzyme S subunit